MSDVSSGWYCHFRCVARHASITQNNKFAVSLQYLKKEVSDEVDFLHVDKHENLLQIDTMILIGIVKHSQSSQNIKFAMSLHYLKKEVRGQVDFCMEINKFLASWFQHFGHQGCLQGNTIIPAGDDQAFSKYSKY